MNVIVTLNSLLLGGSQLNAIDLAVATEQLGVRTLIVGYQSTMPENGPSMVDVAADRGAEVRILETPTDTITAAPALARLADEHDIDLVHAYGGWDLRAAFHGPCRWGRRPLVQTVYEMYVSSQTYPHQPLVVGTGYLVDEQTPVRPGSVDLISPPVDLAADSPEYDPTEFAREFEVDPDRCNIVIVSRLDTSMKEVGVRDSIKAMALLDNHDADLIIVGGGDAETRLRDLARQVNAQLGRTAVKLCGPLHDPRGAYAVADIVIGMGGSAARSLAFGKPLIVCGELGWYRTFDRDSAHTLFRNSFWSDEFEEDSVDMLAGQIRSLVGDADRRRELGVYGREFAERHFGLEQMASRLVEVYERALANHRRRNWFLDLPVEVRPAISWANRKLASVRHRDLSSASRPEQPTPEIDGC